MNNITIKKGATSVLLGLLVVVAMMHPQTTEAKTLVSPVRLKIASINVDAAINPMGLTKAGAMQSPSDAKSVGWFTFGAYPGDPGTAVIDGHYGRWKNGNVSVFDNLHTLKPGDTILVENKKGVVVTFVVRELHVYDKDADASDVFASSDTGAHLNIIACAGVYNETLKTYSDRLVVFADKQ